jgi:hypothetical protein
MKKGNNVLKRAYRKIKAASGLLFSPQKPLKTDKEYLIKEIEEFGKRAAFVKGAKPHG